MKPLRDVITQIIEMAITNSEQAKTMLANLHCNNISLVNFKTVINTLSNEGKEITTPTKGTIWVNTDIDPEVQVYNHLISYYSNSAASTNINLKDIEIEGIEEWERKWAEWRLTRQYNDEEILPEHISTDIPTPVVDERSDDIGSPEMDPSESRESDGVLFVDDSRE